MRRMGKYCKAYHLSRFQEFPGWSANAGSSGNEEPKTNGVTAEKVHNNYFYLQENYTVTTGIFLDDEIVYGNVTVDWINFCTETLKFQVSRNTGHQAQINQA